MNCKVVEILYTDGVMIGHIFVDEDAEFGCKHYDTETTAKGFYGIKDAREFLDGIEFCLFS